MGQGPSGFDGGAPMTTGWIKPPRAAPPGARESNLPPSDRRVPVPRVCLRLPKISHWWAAAAGPQWLQF
jgi:hypothetical protein